MALKPQEPVNFWNRSKDREESEQIYGNDWVRLAYTTRVGQTLTDAVIARRWFSRLTGLYQSSKLSKKAIEKFIHDFKVPMNEYEEASYGSFNDFFIRKFKPESRACVQDAGAMPAFAEARYHAFDQVKPEQSFPVKGENLRAETVLGDLTSARPFIGGPVLIARLCPVDYHRFHFPDDGVTLSDRRIHGKYHSVNPIALTAKNDIFIQNERHISLLETKNFGKMAYVEVGALCVGRIIQTHPWSQPFKRGDEKGYFLFGASTVIVFGEPGKWKPDADLLKNTVNHMETYVRLGDRVASRI